jgi:hypothetical protein
MAEIIDWVYEKAAVNLAKLHEELAAALGEKFVGVSTGRGQVRVHIWSDTPKALQSQIEPIIQAHDASKLTAAQQAEVDRAAKLEALKKPWAQWTAADQAEFVRILAEQSGVIPVG